MNYKNHISRDYYYMEKEPVWDDSDSNKTQKIMTGGYLLNKLVNENEKVMRLNNYGVPAGLVLTTHYSSPNTITTGGNVENNDDDEAQTGGIPPVMPFRKYDQLFDMVSIKTYNNNKTRKLQKSTSM